MLKPSEDRCDYGRLLAPPEGYETVFAAGTTYSLDLDALTGVSLALGLSETMDGSMRDNPVCLLEALRKTADKVALFCEGGQIKAPAKATPLYILLEKMVFEVNLANKKSFHPKVWIVKYGNARSEAIFRFVVLSRNLTFDRSWDVAFSMDGMPKGRIQSSAVPLADFVRYLGGRIRPDGKYAAAKKRKLLDFSKELQTVAFSTGDEHFAYQFCPVGVPDVNGGFYDANSAELFGSYQDLLILTPFLSEETIRELAKSNFQKPSRTLITRKTELYKLKPMIADDFEIFTMKDSVVDGEDALQTDAVNKCKQDLHAKVYLETKYSDSDLYLGSLNASHNACNGNVEFMIRLMAKRRYLNAEALKRDLFCGDADGKENPFERATLPEGGEPPEEETELLQKLIKEICRCKAAAQVEEIGGKYRLSVSFDKLPKTDCVTIAPLLSEKEKPLAGRVVFENLDFLQVSEFYCINASDGNNTVRRVLKIKTENLPDGRENAVVNSIVSDRKSFLMYISFLLGDDALLSVMENESSASPGLATRSSMSTPAFYEQMLKAAATDPERLRGIDDLMKTISDSNVIPERFDGLYSVIRKAVGRK